MPDLVSLPKSTFTTYDELLSQFQDYARVHNYVVTVGRSKREREGIIQTRYI
jgi:hypothetical protein